VILIIEDTLKHQIAARTQFPEAKVVNYDEAYELLHDARPGDFSAILSDLHFKIEEKRTIPAAPFDPHYQENMAAIGTQMPFGIAFVLKGVELGCPVALYSDLSHHSDLFTGLLDMFGGVKWFKDGPSSCFPSGNDKVSNPKFVIFTDSDCAMANDMHWDGTKIVVDPIPPTPDYNDKEAYKAHWEKPVKDWRNVHRQLMAVMQKTASA